MTVKIFPAAQLLKSAATADSQTTAGSPRSGSSPTTAGSQTAEIIDLAARRAASLPCPAVMADSAPAGEDSALAGEDSALTGEDSASALEAKTLAMRLLARRQLASAELAAQLAQAGYAEAEVATVVAECEKSLYLDDAALAVALAQKLRERKGLSRNSIRQHLAGRKLPENAIAAAINQLADEREDELLLACARKRAGQLRDLPRPVAQRRLRDFLARRGWSGEAATAAVNEALGV